MVMENADAGTPLRPDECREPTLEDIPDRIFLRLLLEAQGIRVVETPPSTQPAGLRAWLQRVFGSAD